MKTYVCPCCGFEDEDNEIVAIHITRHPEWKAANR